MANPQNEVAIPSTNHSDNEKTERSSQTSAEKGVFTTGEDATMIEEPNTPEEKKSRGISKAWLYVLATFFMFINAWGLTQTFGAFEEYYVSTLLSGTSPSSISWIGSVQVFLVITLGAFTGPLFDAGYLRPLIVAGCFLIVLGMATLSLATQFWQVFLAQALAVGLGAGLIYVPSLALISTLFPESTRPWAIGCVNSGGSVGGIIYTFMFRNLLPSIGFGWAVRAIALVNLVLSLAALAILAPHRVHKPEHKRALFDLRALREPSFLMFALAQLLNYIAFYIPAFYLPTQATAQLGQGRDFGFESLVFVSVGSFVGRTVPMMAAAYVGSVQVYLAASVAAAVVLFAWMAVHNVAGFVAFAVMYGLVSGVLVAAPSAAISHPTLSPTMSVVGTRMGMGWMFGGLGVLIGAPSAGALVDLLPGHVDFQRAQAFSGAVVAAASLCLIVPFIAVVRYDRKKTSGRARSDEDPSVE
ncbi:major facilitator superfamily domain-containing protein [Hypoxylon sp. NC1633]|nr:major facilitator superfamily domain-containing protein [Hypoxylon sp. NC1633]